MILKIKSANEFLLAILFKNPTTDAGLYFKPLKSGIIVGNAVSPYQYDVLYQDTKNSYAPEMGNQLDFQSFCSPMAILNISTELFGHILKEKQVFEAQSLPWLNKTQLELDTQPCQIEVSRCYIDSGWYKGGQFLLSKYFEGITIEPVVGKNYCLVIQANSVFTAFNLLNLVALFTHMTNWYGAFLFIDDDFAHKYLRILTNLAHVPYFVFYLFIKKTIKSQQQFLALKPIMEQYLANEGIKADLGQWGTQLIRMNFIIDQLDKTKAVLDIGCGGFAYWRRLNKGHFNANYYAVDKDPAVATHASKIKEIEESGRFDFAESLSELDLKEEV
ncbi:MAG TPA: hypothetical protein VL053_13635, partial [Arachidicoccus sp.]|nr:hypothetical protein [Arachidicoccus sp.]